MGRRKRVKDLTSDTNYVSKLSYKNDQHYYPCHVSNMEEHNVPIISISNLICLILYISTRSVFNWFKVYSVVCKYSTSGPPQASYS